MAGSGDCGHRSCVTVHGRCGPPGVGAVHAGVAAVCRTAACGRCRRLRRLQRHRCRRELPEIWGVRYHRVQGNAVPAGLWGACTDRAGSLATVRRISEGCRERAYSVSPAARDWLRCWTDRKGKPGAESVAPRPATADCPEILSGWFMWALRDAVAAAGHYKTAPDAMRFYNSSPTRSTRPVRPAVSRVGRHGRL